MGDLINFLNLKVLNDSNYNILDEYIRYIYCKCQYLEYRYHIYI